MSRNKSSAANKHRDYSLGWERAKAALPAIAALALVYVCHVFIPVGPVTWVLSLVPLVLILLSAIARMGDIEVDKLNPAWNTRRIGLILTALGAAVAIVQPPVTGTYPNWWVLSLMWGIALCWVTDPNLPPFSKFIFKGRDEKEYVHPEQRDRL